jgi:molybdopterin-guanine dinucleotide biosynthesis protein A
MAAAASTAPMVTLTPASSVASASGIVGIVLAGGASSRMGSDKAVLTVRGETLAARAARLLLGVCAQVALADGGRGLLPGLPSLPDGAGRGPAAGILGAAREWPGRALLILACDLPGVPASLLAALAGAHGSGGLHDSGTAHASGGAHDSSGALDPPVAAADWVVPRWERGPEPLCALYGPAALAALAAAVARGIVAPHRLSETPDLAIEYLEGERLRCFGPPADLFLNLNTPADLARWEQLAKG